MRQRFTGTPWGSQPPGTPVGRFHRGATQLCGCLALATVLMAARGSAEVVGSCGFEFAGDDWAFTSAGGGSVNTSLGPEDSPAGQRILSGSQSWTVNGTTSILTFSERLLSGWTNVAVRYRVSSTAGDDGVGHTPSDCVAAYVALGSYADQAKPAFGSTADLTLTGCGSGATWGYNSGADPMVKPVGWGGTLRPAGDGLRTGDGYTDFTIQVPDGQRSLALKLYMKNDSAKKFWNLDDVMLEGVSTLSNDRWWNGGIWSNSKTAKNWATDSSGVDIAVWNSANGDNAYFAQSGDVATIAPGTMVAVRSLTFIADGCVVAAGDSASKIALTNGGCDGPGPNTIDVANAGETATIRATIVANPGVGLHKTGEGTLVLDGANTYTGETVLHAGVLSVSARKNLGAVGTKVTFDGGTLQLTAPADLQGYHPLMFLAGNGAIDTRNHDCTTLTDGWGGTGTLTKIGGGALSLDGTESAFEGSVNIQEGSLRLGSNDALAACSVIEVGVGATFDVTDIAEGYRLGADGRQRLQGAGTILGNLRIDRFGTHDLGNSPGVQSIQGDYTMDGLLEIEINGAAPGDGMTGYDQVLVNGNGHYDVLLEGQLSLAFSGSGWVSPQEKLWVIRNDTDGVLAGTFRGCADGAVVGSYGGYLWEIHYGVDAAGGQFGSGNDVLLMATTAVPEPCTHALLVAFAVTLLFVYSQNRLVPLFFGFSFKPSP